MSIDLGNVPVGTPPSEAEAKQMRSSLGVTTTVSNPTTATGGTINSVSLVDETVFLESSSSSPVASMNFVLPTAANSVLGQIKVFSSSKAITALTVSVSGGGTLVGNTLSAAIPFEAYSFLCISTSGAGRWLRLS